MTATHSNGERPNRTALAAGVLVAVAAAVAGAWWLGRPGAPSPSGAGTRAPAATPAPALTFVGSQACESCHRDEYRRWQGSQHAVAMQPADERTVLGNFADARFSADGATTRFFRRNGRFVVNAEGPDGKPADFEVRHTFGVYPLQQYLIELPRGHVQALTVAWDARPRDQGGQRWFSLYPGERIRPPDELHWTRRQQNWNYMCADCHSTDVRKNYTAATDTYATAWSEIAVGCEACHGPGSAHVALTEQAARDKRALPRSGLTVDLDERKGAAWHLDARTGIAARSAPRVTEHEIDVCAQCHSRRGQFSDGYRAGEPFTDHYRPSLLTDPLYYADGQQRDEVYDWGSFLSSRMYGKGVTCSDCHDPHGGKPRAAGNGVCAQCHLASKYDAPSHHFHEAGSAGAACAGCHMRTRTYMGVDPRHDHSFRIPRPDLTASLGIPNACNQCHADRPAAWAAAEILRRYPQPRPPYQDFAAAFAASDDGRPAQIDLVQVVANQDESAIARASALARLAQWPGENSLLAAEAALQDPSPLVRSAALDVYENLPPPQRRPAIGLLDDPSRLVRLRAARLLAPLPPGTLDAAATASFGRAADEFVKSERYDADRPESRTNLGGYFVDRGDYPAAEAEFRAALSLDERFVPAWVNLADMLRLQGRERDVDAALRQGLHASPNDASLHHALGLSLVRQKRTDDALGELRRAAELAPSHPRFAYVYGVALHSTGRVRDATTVLQRALARSPHDRDLLAALASFAADAGDAGAARTYAERLLRDYPDDRDARTLLQSLGSGSR